MNQWLKTTSRNEKIKRKTSEWRKEKERSIVYYLRVFNEKIVENLKNESEREEEGMKYLLESL